MTLLHQQVAYLQAWAFVTARRVAKSERGAATTETVIITAIFATLALAVGAIIVAKVTNKAESIPTAAPAGG
jgi:hypothetical protein